MKINNMTRSFTIQNNDLEKYSFNLVHYFLDKQDYSIFNFEEKILENFNHEYYNIIIVYSSPLFNDDNIDALFEKISIIKKKLRKNFFVFNQHLLIVATNCNINFNNIDLPKNVDLINATAKEQLLYDDIIKEVYSDIINYPLDLSFEELSYKINSLSLLYAKKVGYIFNKKRYTVNILLTVLLIISFLINSFLPNISTIFKASRENINNLRLYTLLTNNLFNNDLISIVISMLLILTFGIRIEKIFGSIRYLGILIISTILSNVFIFAFYQDSIFFVDFIPIVYAYIGAFIYVIILFRRFLAYTFKRIIVFNMFFLLFIFITGNAKVLLLLLVSILAGFVSAFIFGIPKAKNNNIIHRIMALIFIIILITLSLFIGLK